MQGIMFKMLLFIISGQIKDQGGGARGLFFFIIIVLYYYYVEGYDILASWPILVSTFCLF